MYAPKAGTHDSAGPLCAVCKGITTRYRCPRCQCSLCSFECSRAHKSSASCKSDVDVSLTRELSFLETVGTEVERSARLNAMLMLSKMGETPGRHIAEEDKRLTFKGLSHKVLAATSQAGTIFRQAPTCSELHRRNTTRMSSRGPPILRWRIEVTLNGSERLAMNSVSSQVPLRELINDQLRKRVMDDWEEKYILVLDDLSVPEKFRGYYEIDVAVSLSESLRGLVVIEFPTFTLLEKSRISECGSQEMHLPNIVWQNLPDWAEKAQKSRGECVGMFGEKRIWKSNPVILAPDELLDISIADTEVQSGLHDSETEAEMDSDQGSKIEGVQLLEEGEQSGTTHFTRQSGLLEPGAISEGAPAYVVPPAPPVGPPNSFRKDMFRGNATVPQLIPPPPRTVEVPGIGTNYTTPQYGLSPSSISPPPPPPPPMQNMQNHEGAKRRRIE